MTVPVIWSEEALADLDAITDYVMERDPAAAIRLTDMIEGAVLPTSQYPYLFRPGRVPGTREIVAHPNYIVVYRVESASVRVLAVIHARQRYP